MELKHTYSKKKNIKESIKTFSKHPFFGIVMIIALFLILQFVGMAGLILPSTLNQIALVLIYYIVALGFTLLLGYAGLASLGTAGFIGLGTYVIAVFTDHLGLPTELGVVVGITLSIVLGTIVGFISLRIEGMYLAIVTLGISEILVEVFGKWTITKSGSPYTIFKMYFLGFELKQTDIYSVVYYFIIIAMFLLMVATINIIKSPTGRAMLAMKNSTSAAQAMGISLIKYRLLAFILATFTAGLGGALYYLKYSTTNPLSWGLALSLNILAAVVIGGMKNIYGVLVGTFIVFGLNELVLKRIAFFDNFPSAFMIINGLLIILVVMFYPGGVIRLFTDIKQGIFKLYRKINLTWKEYRYGKDN
ncbi:MAG: branched-chain amino acid ABC transporter permease [Acholeplasmataceae bacterium]|jgi:branched-chain amino acid transport system permease protein|nr:branched-chain amino acid ABC transporter permease [Acholeplasmataceae bacterium]